MTDSIGQVRLRTAHGPIQGTLYVHPIRLIAQEGEHLEVEATVLVPEGWRAPSIVGYVGFLDRMRLAVDPQINYVYFGAIE